MTENKKVNRCTTYLLGFADNDFKRIQGFSAVIVQPFLVSGWVVNA